MQYRITYDKVDTLTATFNSGFTQDVTADNANDAIDIFHTNNPILNDVACLVTSCHRL